MRPRKSLLAVKNQIKTIFFCNCHKTFLSQLRSCPRKSFLKLDDPDLESWEHVLPANDTSKPYVKSTLAEIVKLPVDLWEPQNPQDDDDDEDMSDEFDPSKYSRYAVHCNFAANENKESLVRSVIEVPIDLDPVFRRITGDPAMQNDVQATCFNGGNAAGGLIFRVLTYVGFFVMADDSGGSDAPSEEF